MNQSYTLELILQLQQRWLYTTEYTTFYAAVHVTFINVLLQYSEGIIQSKLFADQIKTKNKFISYTIHFTRSFHVALSELQIALTNRTMFLLSMISRQSFQLNRTESGCVECAFYYQVI